MIWINELELALRENRLAWKCTDPYGRPCNGGSDDYRLALGQNDSPGEWLPDRIPVMHKSGYHVSMMPHQWRGEKVWLVETREPINRDARLCCCVSSLRAIALVDPQRCIDPSVYVASMRNDLAIKDLSCTDLHKAYLPGVDMSGADLSHSCLCYSDLAGARLAGADLSNAKMFHADLHDANLSGANLSNADFGEAHLRNADLKGANIDGANFYNADLDGVK